MPGYPGVHLHPANIQFIHYLKIGFYVPPADIAPLYAFLIGCINDLVIHIRKILYVCHVIAFMFQETMDHVPGHKGTCIADMRMVIGRHAADIDARFPGNHRDKFFFSAGHGIIYLDSHFFHSFCLSCFADITCFLPAACQFVMNQCM